MLGVWEYYALHNRHLHDWVGNAAIIFGLSALVGVLALLAPKVQRDVNPWDVAHDFGLMLFIKFGLLGVVFLLQSWLLGSAPTSVPATGFRIYPLAYYLNLPPLVALVFYIVVRDFAQWVKHRAEHRFRPLWALHKVHHANRSLSIFADYRLHLLDLVVGTGVTFVVLLIAGYPVEYAFIAISLEECVGMLNHSNLLINYGPWLSRVLTSPQNHRVHHSRQSRHLRKNRDAYNFAALFPLWDILAGTYYRDIHDFPTETGVAEEAELERCGLLRRQWIGLRDFVRAFSPRPQKRSAKPAESANAMPGVETQRRRAA